MDRYEHRSWTRENEVGNTAWVPAVKPISLTWKPSGSDIRLNYVNTLAAVLKSFSTICETLTPEISSDMMCPKLSSVYEFWMCRAVLSVSLRWAHGPWPAECINWREDYANKKICRENAMKTNGLDSLYFQNVLAKCNRGWIHTPRSANNEFPSCTALIFALQFYIKRHLEKVGIWRWMTLCLY